MRINLLLRNAAVDFGFLLSERLITRPESIKNIISASVPQYAVSLVGWPVGARKAMCQPRINTVEIPLKNSR